MLHKTNIQLVAFLILSVFIFPMAEKAIHQLEHEEESHCAAFEESHLHEKHHECTTCDYHIDTAQDTDENKIQINEPSFFSETFVFACSPIIIHPYFFPLKAPPVLA